MSRVLDSQTARLEWLLFSHAVIHKLLVFVAYFDDAGTHDDTATEPGSQIVAVAGYVATPEVWEPFEEEWNKVLRREGLKFYHAHDCLNKCGQFTDWERPRRSALHKEFVEIITRHEIVAVGYAGPKAKYNEIYLEHFPDPAWHIPKMSYYNALGNAWRQLGFYISTTKLLMWAPNDWKVSIVVEDSPKTDHMTLQIYRQFLEYHEHQRLARHFEGPPVLRGKEGYPQLQAADVLAYEMALNLRRMYIPGEKPTPRRSYDALVHHAHAKAMKYASFTLLKFESYGLTPNPREDPSA